MHPAIQALILCVAILVSNLLWMIIKNGNFAEACERSYFTILGVIMAYFVFGP